MKYVAVYIKNDHDYSSKAYTFATMFEDLKQGDLVLVDTVNGQFISKVHGYVSKPTFKCRWAFQKIELHKLELLKQQEGTQ